MLQYERQGRADAAIQVAHQILNQVGDRLRVLGRTG